MLRLATCSAELALLGPRASRTPLASGRPPIDANHAPSPVSGADLRPPCSRGLQSAGVKRSRLAEKELITGRPRSGDRGYSAPGNLPRLPSPCLVRAVRGADCSSIKTCDGSSRARGRARSQEQPRRALRVASSGAGMRAERRLRRAAIRAAPRVGKVGDRRARRNPLRWQPEPIVVDEVAARTDEPVRGRIERAGRRRGRREPGDRIGQHHSIADGYASILPRQQINAEILMAEGGAQRARDVEIARACRRIDVGRAAASVAPIDGELHAADAYVLADPIELRPGRRPVDIDVGAKPQRVDRRRPTSPRPRAPSQD